ncbi:polysaccharide pyruvyl transferase family protein [Synechococcus elongatus IITB4]|uniref:polysaccharide pyruvyl transferase family protein n=1 Tax=Synechococcus elongatus TaxID=32046 RepID=UPI0030CA5FEA
MFLEIHGAGFKNKGAELMLRTVVHELQSRTPAYQLAIDPSYGSYLERSSLGLHQTFPVRTHVGSHNFSRNFLIQRAWSSRLVTLLSNRFPKSYDFSQYGCVTLRECQGLIDISGFAFTSQWGSKPTKDFARLTSFYKKKGKPVILLPQAFGPFNNPEIIEAFKKIINNSTKIFARDKISYDYIAELSDLAHEKLYLAPDITLFGFSSKLEENYPNANHFDYVCIIPNIRMIDQGKEQWGRNYISILERAIEECCSHELRVILLIHDTSGSDLKVAHLLKSKFHSRLVSIYQETDPLKLKFLLGRSRLNIGSRYHSIVSSLSMSRPAIALGWSHKYETLLSDFNCQELLVTPNISSEEFCKKISYLLNPFNNKNYQETIAHRLSELRTVNSWMWREVISSL